MEVTQRQSRVFDFLTREMRVTHRPPSIREIAVALGISIGTVHSDLRQLEMSGQIRREHGKSRAMAVVGLSTDSDAVVRVPIFDETHLQRGSAGVTKPSSHIVLPVNVSHEGALVVRIGKPASAELGILPGDLLLVDPRADVITGAVVVVRTNDRIDIGRVLERDGRWLLMRLSTTGAPQLPLQDLIGVATALFRFVP